MNTAPDIAPGSVLHVGCGGDPLHPFFSGCTETRLDIDPACKPDIIASMTDLGDIGPFDYIYSCHSLEHLAPAGVAVALSEFHRVLRDGGLALIVVPDVEGVQPTTDVLYTCPAGGITGHDLYYGFRPDRNQWMAHKTAFIRPTLHKALAMAGFEPVQVTRARSYQLIGIGHK